MAPGTVRLVAAIPASGRAGVRRGRYRFCLADMTPEAGRIGAGHRHDRVGVGRVVGRLVRVAGFEHPRRSIGVAFNTRLSGYKVAGRLDRGKPGLVASFAGVCCITRAGVAECCRFPAGVAMAGIAIERAWADTRVRRGGWSCLYAIVAILAGIGADLCRGVCKAGGCPASGGMAVGAGLAWHVQMSGLWRSQGPSISVGGVTVAAVTCCGAAMAHGGRGPSRSTYRVAGTTKVGGRHRRCGMTASPALARRCRTAGGMTSRGCTVGACGNAGMGHARRCPRSANRMAAATIQCAHGRRQVGRGSTCRPACERSSFSWSLMAAGSGTTGGGSHACVVEMAGWQPCGGDVASRALLPRNGHVPSLGGCPAIAIISMTCSTCRHSQA